MGLAAGQARLLSITARKSDCEFQSMRLSHQKIAMARELADLSNEYQNSLTQTKLIYDYYGTGDTSTPLTYGLMMSPSALNDYMPITLTSGDGRVVLNSKLARAAKDAGIPQEGLGTLPSEELRNRFIFGLEGTGVINSDLAKRITELPYAQGAGFGGGATVSTLTKEVNWNEFTDLLNNYPATYPFSIGSIDINKDKSITNNVGLYDLNNKTCNFYYDGNHQSTSNCTKQSENSPQLTLGQILNGNITMVALTSPYMTSSIGYDGGAIDAIVTSSVWDDMFAAIEDLLDTGDTYSQTALAYAREKIEYLISNQCDTTNKTVARGETHADKYTKRQFNNDEDMCNFAIYKGTNKHGVDSTTNDTNNWVDQTQSGYIGLVSIGDTDSGHDGNGSDYCGTVGVNISTVMKAYLTYYADFINGLAATDEYGDEVYSVGKTISSSNLVDETTMFTVKTGKEFSSDDLGQATFYDALFNQICAHGWVENNEVSDKDYLKQMLESGKMFVSRVNEDNYYYQTNYGTDNYIKEIPDETLIAYAEAKYSTEKAKLNSKEETIDLKMKNLDTEISSLTTEYDTVKNTISKNIEKSFKRFSA